MDFTVGFALTFHSFHCLLKRTKKKTHKFPSESTHLHFIQINTYSFRAEYLLNLHRLRDRRVCPLFIYSCRLDYKCKFYFFFLLLSIRLKSFRSLKLSNPKNLLTETSRERGLSRNFARQISVLSFSRRAAAEEKFKLEFSSEIDINLIKITNWKCFPTRARGGQNFKLITTKSFSLTLPWSTGKWHNTAGQTRFVPGLNQVKLVLWCHSRRKDFWRFWVLFTNLGEGPSSEEFLQLPVEKAFCRGWSELLSFVDWMLKIEQT